MSFSDRGIEPHPGFSGDDFIVRPLVPADVMLDHDAVMASREFLYHWEQDPPYRRAERAVRPSRTGRRAYRGRFRRRP